MFTQPFPDGFLILITEFRDSLIKITDRFGCVDRTGKLFNGPGDSAGNGSDHGVIGNPFSVFEERHIQHNTDHHDPDRCADNAKKSSQKTADLLDHRKSGQPGTQFFKNDKQQPEHDKQHNEPDQIIEPAVNCIADTRNLIHRHNVFRPEIVIS